MDKKAVAKAIELQREMLWGKTPPQNLVSLEERPRSAEEQAQRGQRLLNLLQVYKTRLNLKGRKPKFLKR